MLKFFKDKSITFVTLFIYILFTVITFTIIFSFFQVKLKEIVIDNTYQQNYVDASNIKHYMDASLESYENLMIGFAHYLEDYETMSLEEINSYSQEILSNSDYLLSVELMNESYVVEYSYPSTRDTVGYNFQYNIEDYQLLNNESVWTEPFSSPFETEPYMSVILRYDDAYYVGNFSLYFMDEIYQNIKASDEYKVIIIHNAYGVFVYDSKGNREINRIKCNNFEDFLSRYNGEVSSKTILINEEDAIVATEYLVSQNWYITVYETMDNATSFFMTITSFMALIFGVLILVYFITVLSINSLIKRNLSLVSENIDSVTRGDYDVKIEDYLFQDFQLITSSFNQMGESLQKSRNTLENLAYYDQLTNLHSRNYVDVVFNEMKEKFNHILFVYIDIERFKLVNDLYGYDFANKIMIEIANRLRNLPIKNSYPFRSDGDAFILLINADELEAHSKNTVNYVTSSLQRAYHINNSDVEVKVNAGVSVYPEDGFDSQLLISNCLFALQDAKKLQTENICYYDVLRKEEFRRKIDIEASLDKAFEREEFYPVFQPLIIAKTGKIRGFEVLSRWENKELGFIRPDEFIPILEQNHKIGQLDKFVLQKAIERAQILKENFDIDLVVSINVSVETIILDDYVKFVKKTLKNTKYNPEFLELEVTESTIISDFDLVSSRMNELREVGIKFAEDDFGDGFSALNYLTSLELDTLKISINITKTLRTNKNNQILLRFIINLAEQFGFDTVIEGIEDEETAKICIEYGCTYMQGYYYYKPMKFQDLYEEIKKLSNK